MESLIIQEDINFEKQIIDIPCIWRETLSDNAIPSVNYTPTLNETAKPDPKDQSQNDYKLIIENVNPSAAIHLPRSIVYHKQHGYIQIKKYNEQTKSYICKLKLGKNEQHLLKEQEELEFQPNDLSDRILIDLHIILENSKINSLLAVGINDKVSSIQEINKDKGVSYAVLYKGSIIGKQDTFQSLSVNNLDKLLLLPGKQEAKTYRRFKNMGTESDYWYCSESYYDAICITPTSDVYILGFVSYGMYDKTDFKLMWKYKTDDHDSEKYEVEITNDQVVDRMVRVLFDNIEPIFVQAGKKIHIGMMTKNSGPNNRLFYGYDGYDHGTLPENEDKNLFAIDYSELSQNGTGASSGQIPMILYALA